ncbi:DNA ligase D [Candidatus Nitrospira bockiana]
MGVMGLQAYRRKRSFEKTPEPPGSTRTAGGADRTYVIQKHAARRLHYDFRLEHGGVLKSWAIPKGPSLDPKEKRLAVEVEDHPIEYGGFEGTIPEGQYGAGSVLLWDRGRWTPEGDPEEGLRKGKLKFRLDGEKLHGGWTLVRLRRQEGDKPNWLLIKEQDEHVVPEARGRILEDRPESIASGRSIESIGGTREAVWHSDRDAAGGGRIPDPSQMKGASKGPMPEAAFQLATLVKEPPVGDAWVHEIKLDGFRLQCRLEQGRVQLLTRTGQDWTARFPSVVEAASRVPARSALLDGELVAVDPAGHSSFQLLQQTLSGEARAPLAYYAFDLLYLNGYRLAAAPLESRKECLKALLAAAGDDRLRYSDHIVGQGEPFYREACRLGLEGMISKRREAAYRPGRSADWLKVKCLRRQEFVVGGFTEPSGSRHGFGALLLGVYEGEGANRRLRYVGRVGTGFTERGLRALLARLAPLEQTGSPFADRVPGPRRSLHWVRPVLVVEIAFTEWTADGFLRHPSFQGIREDKAAHEVRRETPAEAPGLPPAADQPPAARPARRTVELAGIRLTHPDRVLYPELGITKRDLAGYYDSIAEWILPHVAGRPLMVLRCPDGHGGECFHQKHRHDRVPSAVGFAEVEEESGKKARYLMIEDRAGLIALAQMGVLEIHVWGARQDRLECPDRMVFDLDPDEALPWARVVETARLVRDRLEKLGLNSWVKTTGGKGLHVTVPLTGEDGWDEVKRFSQSVAEGLVRDDPRAYTSTMSKAARRGKIFIDYLRNSRGATAIAPYSTRARRGAPVAVPLDWKELEDVVPSELTIQTVPTRVARLRRDPWQGLREATQSLSAAAKALTRR